MKHASPKFSLIVATYGEGRDLRRFLDSLRNNVGPTFEVIIVDQNAVPHLHLVQEYSACMDIRLLRSAPGLSAARNVGMRAARGAILAFPDDDCWYPHNLLSMVERRMENNAVDGFTCRCVDEQGLLAAGADDRRPGPVTKRNVWGRGVSATIFVRQRLTRAVGAFDEELGLGARTMFQSGEETDYLLRAIKAGFRIEYDPSIAVHHPLPNFSHSESAVRKSASYGAGMGRILRMHEYGVYDVLRYVVTPLFGAAIASVRGDAILAKVRWARALARYRGWRWQPGREA